MKKYFICMLLVANPLFGAADEEEQAPLLDPRIAAMQACITVRPYAKDGAGIPYELGFATHPTRHGFLAVLLADDRLHENFGVNSARRLAERVIQSSSDASSRHSSWREGIVDELTFAHALTMFKEVDISQKTLHKGVSSPAIVALFNIGHNGCAIYGSKTKLVVPHFADATFHFDQDGRLLESLFHAQENVKILKSRNRPVDGLLSTYLKEHTFSIAVRLNGFSIARYLEQNPPDAAAVHGKDCRNCARCCCKTACECFAAGCSVQ